MSITEKIRQHILANYLFTDDPAALADDDSFLEQGIIDSTGIMEVIFFLEEEFGIRVDDDELIPENLDSVNRIARFVQRKRVAA
ncbi:acyl carrier protein [Alkalilimnicola ehrlichii]|uniref:Acyl carrier protein n=1 Tax=Alkalilimnicola ehrlichii TaxID=351052 RepID=A0A3E0WJ35_9GAMM|nr:acyl carrier protein [Alkalilimnicola ehrlichii]RFA32117.1 acyl carrier protein [Alkalilimnicola ehrlichii]